MGQKCCGPSSVLNCEYDNIEYSSQGIMRRPGQRPSIRQSSNKPHRDIEGMKRQIEEYNVSQRSHQTSSFTMAKRGIGLIDGDESTSMSFLKGADRDDSVLEFSQNLKRTGVFGEGEGGGNPLSRSGRRVTQDYQEWDQMTFRMEENYEITSEARDYNNNDIDDSRSEIPMEDES